MSDSQKALFEENLKRYLDGLPIKPEGFDQLDVKSLEFCQTAKGELNLKTLHEGREEAYESQEGAAEYWSQECKKHALLLYDVVLCYGLGLGYLVDALDTWLREVPKWRKLVVIEDDPKVIARFLESPRAKSILEHPQVKIVYIREISRDDNILLHVLSSCAILPHHFRHLLFLSLPYYARARDRDFLNLQAQVYHLKEIVERGRETSYYMQDVIYNHLKNLQHLPESYDVCKTPRIFEGIPAIICGGGASLEDVLQQLEELQDRAMIVGVGAGINILSQAGIRPHLCCGLDPTMKHTARMMMNAQFEVPFLYSTRMHYRGLELLQAPLLATFNEGGDEVQWIFEKLHLESGRGFSGVGVGNYACNYLQLMGCDPLMMVGIDLAHTKGKAYAEGFKQHPLASELSACKSDTQIAYLRDISEEEKAKLSAEEEYLNLAITSQFILEARAYEEFAEGYPETTYINLSLIGTKINHFDRMSLEEAKSKYLQSTIDISSLMHGRIFQSKLEGVDREKVSSYFQEWVKHVEEAHQSCQKILEELKKLDEVGNEKELPQPIQLMILEFSNNPCYGHLFSRYANYYAQMEKLRLEWWPSEESIVELAIERASYLLYIASTALEFFENLKTEIDVAPEKNRPRFPALEGVAEEKPGEGDLYSLQEGELTIIDWDLDLSYHEPFQPVLDDKAEERIERMFYPSGALEFEQHRKGGKLHGPTTYHGKNGEILSTAWYVLGMKQGKAWRYYPSGALYAVERYRNGKRQGQQEYFYESGLHRSILHYQQGLLDGDITLYHPNGVKKRVLHFKEGKREGDEKIWDANGTLRGEISYTEDKAMGSAFSWYEDGSKQLELIYWAPDSLESSEEWNKEGDLIKKQIFSGNRMIHQVEQMVHKLDDLQEQLHQVESQLPSLEELEDLRSRLNPKEQAEFDLLRAEMQKLEKLLSKGQAKSPE